MRFLKLHGAGNDFICATGPLADPDEAARRLCSRHFGVGADGLLLLSPSDTADFRMEIYNCDGSRAAMCGNGIRCAAKFAADCGLLPECRQELVIETDSGPRTLRLQCDPSGAISGATVDMGAPLTGGRLEVPVGDAAYPLHTVSMGNPHAVLFVSAPDPALLRALGPALQTHPLFPDGINLELAHVAAPDRIEVLVWERGAGETLACGTGACACLAAAVLDGRTGREADVVLPGGTLHVRWSEGDNHLYMTGPAVTVFEGRLL